MRNFIWSLIVRLVLRYRDAVIKRAMRTPYSHITGPDGSVYMRRFWLFNPYGRGPNGETLPARWGWLPSVRVHHIMRPDSDRHLHDHPWNARTIVLAGSYVEERPCPFARHLLQRREGYTGRLLFGEFHRIDRVSDGGVWTLFFTWRYRGTWGFLVDGNKIPWREYLDNSVK